LQQPKVRFSVVGWKWVSRQHNKGADRLTRVVCVNFAPIRPVLSKPGIPITSSNLTNGIS
jgi:hypothetical protein